MGIKFNPLGLEGFDITGGGVGIGSNLAGSAGNSIVTTDSSGNITEKILNDGQLLIGKTGDEPQIASLTGTTNQINVSNGPGSITLSTPQDIAPSSHVQFASVQTSSITTSSGDLSLNPSVNVDVNSKKIVNLQDPTALQDAATKNYVDLAIQSVYNNPDFTDDVFRISDDVDNSKKIAFEASALSASTTRTISMPDQNIDLGLVPTAIQQNGSVAFTSNQSMGMNRLVNVANPINPLDAANKDYVDTALAGLDFQPDVDNYVLDASTTAPGVGLPPAALGQRYILSSNTSSLHSNWGTIAGVGDNDIVEYNGSNWFVAYDVSIHGEGALVWQRSDNYFMRWNGTDWFEFGGLAGVTAGAGLDKTGHTIFVELDTIPGLEFDTPGDAGKLRVKVDDSTIERHSSGLRVKASGITSNELATDSVTTPKIQNNAVNGAKIRLNNDEWLKSRNAADTLDINIVRINNSDQIELSNTILPQTDDAFSLGSTSRVWTNTFTNSISNTTGNIVINPASHLSVSSKKIINVQDPTAAQDAATKNYVDSQISSIYSSPEFNDNVFRIRDNGDTTKKIAFEASAISTATTRTITMPDQDINLGLLPTAIQRNGSVTFTADQSMGGFNLTNVATPTASHHAATKGYVDSLQDYTNTVTTSTFPTTLTLTNTITDNSFAFQIHASLNTSGVYRDVVYTVHGYEDKNTNDYVISVDLLGDSFPELTLQMNNTSDTLEMVCAGSLSGTLTVNVRKYVFN
ncbi:MAG: hypothetical protein ABIM30_01140 [candidate division WOR-3 bacterium]